MKSTIYATREYFHKYGSRLVAFAMSVVIVTILSLAFTTIASAQTFASVSSSADIGSRGANVTNIQTFLASNPSIYPEGLITGYYGQLTAAAVRRFQVQYGIVSSGTAATTGFGRVGPMTLAKMNALIAAGGMTSGGGSSTGDTSGPSLFNVNYVTNSNSVTFNLNTNEPAMVRVVYGTSPLMFNEGDINSNGFGPIGGSAVNSSSGLSTSHSVIVSNLNNNTAYYFTIIATDAAGNVSVWGPNNAIRTNQ
jgi:peptidoglycan hydrolase-like protein with peptidoglycan-binding domain